jgi:hypothetical protein
MAGMFAQHVPCPRRRLESVLDQVRRQLTVAAGARARVPEQPLVMSREEIGQLGDVAYRDPDLAAVIHVCPHT